MPNVWTPEAEYIAPANPSGTPLGGGTVKCIAHVTTGSAFSPGSWQGAIDTLRERGGEPHYLVDVIRDRVGQFYPLTVSSRSLKRGWGYDVPWSCNKMGDRIIQIEFIAEPDGFTRYWKPGPNFRAMMRDIRANGVPDRWPGGLVAQSPSDNRRMTWTDYVRASGWIGHSQVPLQDHWDPGPIDQLAIFAAAPPNNIPTIPPSEELTMAQIDTLTDLINSKVATLRKDLVLDGGTGDKRHELLVKRLDAQGRLLMALAEQVGAGDQAILDAIENLKAAEVAQ